MMMTAPPPPSEQQHHDQHEVVIVHTNQQRQSYRRRCSMSMMIIVVLFRLLTGMFLVSETQFDPDEYWQTLEVAQCMIFGGGEEGGQSSCYYTWEWKTRRRRVEMMDDAAVTTETTTTYGNNTIVNLLMDSCYQGPVRTYVNVLPTAGLYYLLSYLEPYLSPTWSQYIFAKSPVILHTILFVIPTDWCIYNLSQFLFSSTTTAAYWALLCSLCSWFMSYAYMRTYSNSVEATLTMWGIYLLKEDLFFETTKTNNKKRTIAFVLGGMCVCIRFSSIVTWITTGIMAGINNVSRQQQHQPTHDSSSCKDNDNKQRTFSPCSLTVFFKYLINPCALWGFMGIVFTSVIDRICYGYWTFPLVGNFCFNVLENKSALYGTHPWYWYFLVGIPTVTGTMLPFVIWSCFDNIKQCFLAMDSVVVQRRTNDNQDERTLLFLISIYVIFHSMSPHKEFRFLMPIVPLVCIISGQQLNKLFQMLNRKRKKQGILLVMIVPNLIALIYLGLVHQRGSIQVNRQMVQLIQDYYQSDSMSDTNNRIWIDYLMECHSTPLYSHLHTGHLSLQLEATILDCSPSCRLYENCESYIFHHSPLDFVQQRYHSPSTLSSSPDQTCSNADADEDDNNNSDMTSCATQQLRQEVNTSEVNTIPDLIVMFETEAKALHKYLVNELHMQVARKIKHQISNMQLTTIQPFINFEFEHVYIYSRRGQNEISSVQYSDNT